MKDTFQDLFEYNDQCNRDFIKLITQHSDLPERVRLLMSHILNAQGIWLDRILGRDTTFSVWEIHQDEQLIPLQESLSERTRSALLEVNLADGITYTNTKGFTYQNSIQDVFLHIINHSTQHRGQISAQLSQLGIKPPTNDYIFRRRSPLN